MGKTDVRPAQKKDLPHIMEIFAATSDVLQNEGLETMIAGYLLKDQLFVACTGVQIIGMIAIIHNIKRKAIAHIKWIVDTDNYIYITLLRIDPVYLSTNAGKELFDYAHTLAERRGYASIRLDAARQLSDKYRSCGFQAVGSYTQSGRLFYCYGTTSP